jgi:multidrug efflux pump subunit AcrA (membrane-fusion protein)
MSAPLPQKALPLLALSPSRAVLALQSAALAAPDAATASRAVVDELLRLCSAHDAVLAHVRGAQVRVQHWLPGAEPDRRLAALQQLERVLGLAVDEQQMQRWPEDAAQASLSAAPPPESRSDAPPPDGDALRAWAGDGWALAVPAREAEHITAALALRGPGALPPAVPPLLHDVALFVLPLLRWRARSEASGSWRWARLRAGRGRWVLAAGAAAAAAVLLWPVTDDIVAPARAEGLVQHVVAAPGDGFIGQVSVRAGDRVAKGQVLVVLEQRDLVLEQERRQAALAQLERQYRDALAADEAGPIVAARSKLEQARLELELAARQLARAELRAPIDGIVLAAQLEQQRGAPVRRGQELLTLAPGQGLRVVAEVDEQEIAAVQPGQRGQVLWAGSAQQPLALTVSRVAPVASVRDGRNVFEVHAELPQADGLRPGLRGVLRLPQRDTVQAAVWWRRGSDALRRLAWRFST